MNTIKRIIDTSLFFSFCFLAGSGILMKFSFVKGLGPQRVLGFSKPEWCDLHLWISLFMGIAIIAHIFVNRAWITKVALKNRSWGFALVLILGIGLIAVLALAPTEIIAK